MVLMFTLDFEMRRRAREAAHESLWSTAGQRACEGRCGVKPVLSRRGRLAWPGPVREVTMPSRHGLGAAIGAV